MRHALGEESRPGSPDDALCWAALVRAPRYPEVARWFMRNSADWPIGLVVFALRAHDWQDDPVSVPLVERCVRDGRVIPALRWRFIQDLARLGGEGRHAAAIVDAMAAEEEYVSQAAETALGELLGRCAPHVGSGRGALKSLLMASMKRGYARCRIRIVRFLESVGVTLVDPLIEAVAEEDRENRIVAAEALGRMGEIRAAEALRVAACDHDPEVAEAAANALMALGPALIGAGESSARVLARVLHRGPRRLFAFALKALGQIPCPQSSDATLRFLAMNVQPELRIWALEALSRIGDHRVVEPLVQMLRDEEGDEEGEVQGALGDALASIASRFPPDVSMVPFLERALLSLHPSVTAISTRKLAEIGTTEAVRVLARSLSTPQKDLRIQSLMALQQLKSLEALGPVLDLLPRCAPPVAEHAVQLAITLVRKAARQGGPDSELLARALASSHVELAREAAKALDARRDGRAVRLILDTCLRGDVVLSSIAGRALREMATSEVIAWLTQVLSEGDDRMAAGAEAALIAIGPQAVAPLKKAAKWSYSRARLAAVRALGAIGDGSAETVLRGALRDPDPLVCQAAALALERLSINEDPTQCLRHSRQEQKSC